MMTIPVGPNQILVDDFNFHRIQNLALSDTKKVIQVAWLDTNGKRKAMPLSKIILQTDAPIVDHKDRNHRNFQINNLRPCTIAENNCNRGKQHMVSGRPSGSHYKGVSWRKPYGFWRAIINSGGQRTYIGSFRSEEDAAHAYDLKAIELHGEFAVLNFPDEAAELSLS